MSSKDRGINRLTRVGGPARGCLAMQAGWCSWMRSTMFPAVPFAAALIFIASLGTAAAQDQAILGLWTTDKGKGRVEIVNCVAPKQGLCGTIVWISEPNDKDGKPQTDKANKNRSLRDRPIVGLPIFEGWRAAGTNKW